jgi:E3 ubiquitin-protein ligase FANCL
MCMSTEMDTVGWNRLTSLDDSLTSIRIRITDSDARDHIITVKLTLSYPNDIPQCTCDIPMEVPLTWWIPSTSTLADIVRYYQTAIDSLCPLYRVLDDIDRHCWVLEPTPPRPRAITWRRIVLGTQINTLMTLPNVYYLIPR